MTRAMIIILTLVSALYVNAETIELEKKDYLTLVVGNYVHGFKEFDTTVVGFDDSVKIIINDDSRGEKRERANQGSTTKAVKNAHSCHLTH